MASDTVIRTADEQSFYRVEQDEKFDVCPCGHNIYWTIVSGVGGAEVGISTSWQGPEGRELAEDVCDLMNMAFDAGLEHEHHYAKEPASPLGYVCACGELPPVGWYPDSPDV